MTTTTAAAPTVRRQAANAHAVLIHDIRTPLAAITGYAQLLVRRSMAANSNVAGLAEGLRRIEEAATRVEHLLDELTDHYPVQGAEGTDRQRHMVDLVLLAKRIAEDSAAAARGRSSVVVLSSVPVLVGWWSAARLERVLANLIDNALKYNRQEHPILVSLQHVAGWAVVSVADKGVGIPAREVAHVFEPGYRASNVASQASGSGLGLAGADQIVAAHGGTISLDSQLGRGTTVTVRLPLGAPAP